MIQDVDPDPYGVIDIRKLQRQVYILAALNVILLLGGGYEFARRHGSRPPATATAAQESPNPAVALVNGQPLRREQVVAVLEHVHGPQVLREMVQEEIILQAAQQAGLQLDDPDSLLAMHRLTEQRLKAEGLEIESRRLRARLLLRKLLLEPVTPETRHQFYDEFKDQLTQYEIFVLVAHTPGDTHKISAGLKSGKAFAELASTSRPPGGRLGFLTLRDANSTLGPEVTQAIEDAADRLSSGRPVDLPPMKIRHSTVFVHIGSVKNNFTDLSPSIDDVLAQAGKTAMLEHLIRTSKVTYPLLDANLKQESASPSSTPTLPTADSSVFAPVPSAAKKKAVFGPVPDGHGDPDNPSPSASPSAASPTTQ